MLEEETTTLKKASNTAVVVASTSSSHFDNSTKCPEAVWQDAAVDDINVDCDSYGSMETLSDTVSITIDGEKHWVSGIDTNTTCADLISALLQYQDLEAKNINANTCRKPSKLGRFSQITIHNQATIAKTKEDAEQAAYSKNFKSSHEYVIVKQLRHCQFEEYLDGSTRLLDVIPLRDSLAKKQCELQLRNLARTRTALTSSRGNNQNQNHNQMFSMLSMSTDKDSGMGSPVGSSRSDRFRRRRGKQRSAIATVTTMELYRGAGGVGGSGSGNQQQANPAQPKRSKEQQQQEQEPLKHCNMNPNERLMNIILAQDETINRQMYLLNEKEQQILKIEEEKHRVRERELGKNYLVDAYLNTNKNVQDFEEQRQRIPNLKTDNGDLKRYETSETRQVDVQLPDDMQIYWLEKVYSLNKLLQREEEQLLRLHAKVRKQQVRYAYHTKGEVLQQIDRLDTELAIQVTDIYRVERQLLMANEQLKAKLGVLECLGREFEVLPLENLEIDTSSINCNTLEFNNNEDAMQHLRETIEKPANYDLQVDDIKHLPQHLLEKNSNVRHLTDAKMLKKQMFCASDDSANIYAIVTNNNCKETDPYPVATDLTKSKTNIISVFAESDFDIEHLGTLV